MCRAKLCVALRAACDGNIVLILTNSAAMRLLSMCNCNFKIKLQLHINMYFVIMMLSIRT